MASLGSLRLNADVERTRMSSRTPIVRQIAWLSVVPQLTIMGLIMWLLSIAGVRQSIVFGALR